MASQIYNTANNMLEINWAPVVGALVITKKAWDEMNPSTQEAVRIAGEKAGEQLRIKARLEVEEAVEAMKKRGLVVNKPNAEQMKEWNNLALSLYPKIRGTMVPAETFDEVFKHLNAFRSGKHK
jgi:TRAP-type C4-dicarboxylate transport system substrate-binding protein